MIFPPSPNVHQVVLHRKARSLYRHQTDKHTHIIILALARGAKREEGSSFEGGSIFLFSLSPYGRAACRGGQCVAEGVQTPTGCSVSQTTQAKAMGWAEETTEYTADCQDVQEKRRINAWSSEQYLLLRISR